MQYGLGVASTLVGVSVRNGQGLTFIVPVPAKAAQLRTPWPCVYNRRIEPPPLIAHSFQSPHNTGMTTGFRLDGVNL